MALTIVLSGLGPAAVALVLLAGGSASTALLAYLLAQGSTLLPAWWLTHRAGLLPPLRGRLSKSALRELGRFVLMAGALLLFTLTNGFNILNLGANYQGVIEGTVVVTAAAIYTVGGTRRRKR